MTPCFECGSEAHHDHHVVPRVVGGTRTVPLCAMCHGKVHDRNLMTLSHLTRAALRAKRARGERAGAIPFGFTLGEDGQKLVADPEETRALAHIDAMLRVGLGLNEMARQLNAAGVKAKNGGRWYASTVRSVVSTGNRKAAS